MQCRVEAGGCMEHSHVGGNTFGKVTSVCRSARVMVVLRLHVYLTLCLSVVEGQYSQVHDRYNVVRA